MEKKFFVEKKYSKGNQIFEKKNYLKFALAHKSPGAEEIWCIIVPVHNHPTPKCLHIIVPVPNHPTPEHLHLIVTAHQLLGMICFYIV